jgi:hypothetical protein
MELYYLYEGIKFGAQTIDWAAQHVKLAQLEAQMKELEAIRPAERGHPEWAKADGTFDRRREPFPSMRNALNKAKDACDRKDKDMLFGVLERFEDGECATKYDAMLELQHSLKLIE